jgi:hypothetical protein
MSNNTEVEISETAEFGVALLCKDAEIADQFEDFLTEKCFVLFNLRSQDGAVSFYFGQASTQEKVRELYARFLSDREAFSGPSSLSPRGAARP